MAKVQEPLYYSQLECPVCKTVNEYAIIKNGAYTESGRDTDFCPTGRVWQNPAYQKFDPLLFFMATCRKCYYTHELDNDFKNWQKDSSFKAYRLKTIQEKHLADYLNDNGLVKFLGSHLDENRYPCETAIIKFILGIFDEKCLDRPSKLNIGRYFIRIGWLFRTHNLSAADSSEGAGGFLARQAEAVIGIGKSLSDNKARIDDLGGGLIRDFDIALAQLQSAADLKKAFGDHLERIKKSLDTAIEATGELSRVLIDARQALASGSTGSGEYGFFEFRTFAEFLQQTKLKWSETPLNEAEALLRARDYYKQAYESGDKVTTGIGQLQAAYLIAELSRRTGDHATANEFFNIVIRNGRDFVHGKKGDSSSIAYAKKLLEMAMEQARKSIKEKEEVAV